MKYRPSYSVLYPCSRLLSSSAARASGSILGYALIDTGLRLCVDFVQHFVYKAFTHGLHCLVVNLAKALEGAHLFGGEAFRR